MSGARHENAQRPEDEWRRNRQRILRAEMTDTPEWPAMIGTSGTTVAPSWVVQPMGTGGTTYYASNLT